jgi:hypothetical protein
MVGGESRSEAL